MRSSVLFVRGGLLWQGVEPVTIINLSLKSEHLLPLLCFNAGQLSHRGGNYDNRERRVQLGWPSFSVYVSVCACVCVHVCPPPYTHPLTPDWACSINYLSAPVWESLDQKYGFMSSAWCWRTFIGVAVFFHDLHFSSRSVILDHPLVVLFVVNPSNC